MKLTQDITGVAHLTSHERFRQIQISDVINCSQAVCDLFLHSNCLCLNSGQAHDDSVLLCSMQTQQYVLYNAATMLNFWMISQRCLSPNSICGKTKSNMYTANINTANINSVKLPLEKPMQLCHCNLSNISQNPYLKRNSDLKKSIQHCLYMKKSLKKKKTLSQSQQEGCNKCTEINSFVERKFKYWELFLLVLRPKFR